MRSNLEHINQGHSGTCRKCKRHWKYKDASFALADKYGLRGEDGFRKVLAMMNSFAIDFDCDNCGEANTILPVSIKEIKSSTVSEQQEAPEEFQANHRTVEEAEAHLDKHFSGWHKMVQDCVYENGESLPRRGKCKCCGEEYELVYPLLGENS